MAFGAPAGLQQTVTRGIVSAFRTGADIGGSSKIAPNLKLIQTDAAINPGNSGGPLIDKHGQVVGVNSFKLRSGEGIGFAIAAEELKSIFEVAGLSEK